MEAHNVLFYKTTEQVLNNKTYADIMISWKTFLYIQLNCGSFYTVCFHRDDTSKLFLILDEINHCAHTHKFIKNYDEYVENTKITLNNDLNHLKICCDNCVKCELFLNNQEMSHFRAFLDNLLNKHNYYEYKEIYKRLDKRRT